MSPKENLLRLIDQLPEERLAELERLAISMMPTDHAPEQPREPRMGFDEALALANQTLPKTLKRLSQ